MPENLVYAGNVNAGERCERCRFWNSLGLEMDHCVTDGPQGYRPVTLGQCQRYAPQALHVAEWDYGVPDGYVSWPRTLACDWCGDYMPYGPGDAHPIWKEALG